MFEERFVFTGQSLTQIFELNFVFSQKEESKMFTENHWITEIQNASYSSLDIDEKQDILSII